MSSQPGLALRSIGLGAVYARDDSSFRPSSSARTGASSVTDSLSSNRPFRRGLLAGDRGEDATARRRGRSPRAEAQHAWQLHLWRCKEREASTNSPRVSTMERENKRTAVPKHQRAREITKRTKLWGSAAHTEVVFVALRPSSLTAPLVVAGVRRRLHTLQLKVHVLVTIGGMIAEPGFLPFRRDESGRSGHL